MRCLPGPPDGRMVGSKQLPLYRTGNLPELRVETRPAPPWAHLGEPEREECTRLGLVQNLNDFRQRT